MKISARNVFKSKITAVKAGAVNSEIDLTTAGGDKIVAIVTNDSVKSLGLAVGKDATALVKASSVLVLADGAGVKLSARNCLTGKITKITEGPVSAEVSIALAGGGAVHATITHDASAELGLKTGATATAVFKASAVIIAVAA
jgi:molybdate transport system regulatory protein